MESGSVRGVIVQSAGSMWRGRPKATATERSRVYKAHQMRLRRPCSEGVRLVYFSLFHVNPVTACTGCWVGLPIVKSISLRQGYPKPTPVEYATLRKVYSFRPASFIILQLCAHHPAHPNTSPAKSPPAQSPPDPSHTRHHKAP